MLRLVRLLWGGTLLLAPRRVLARVERPSSRGVLRATRILGARQVAEVLVLARRREANPPLWPLLVDLIHALTMIALAKRSRRLRRDALASASAALLLAGWGELERRRF
jgi:hypothetical protein